MARNDELRFMVLGGDYALLDKACGTILGERENRDSFIFGELEPREAEVCGRQVSGLKTPPTWLKLLKTNYIFSNGVRSIEAELQNFELKLFPGPHVFLLVHRDGKNSGKEYYLLQALSQVFGNQVLDYCMVLFVDKAVYLDPKRNLCMKMCGNRYHILQNNDESVNELFRKVEKNNRFFTNHLERFKKAEIYFQKKFSAMYKDSPDGSAKPVRIRETEKPLKEEIVAKVNELNKKITDTESNLRREMAEKDEQHKQEIAKLTEQFRETEKKMKEEIDSLKCLMLDKHDALEKEIEDLKRKVRETQAGANIDRIEGDLKQDMMEEHNKIRHGSEQETLHRMDSTSPAYKDRPLDEKGDTESREKDSQASDSHESGGVRRVKRRSMESPPEMSGRESEPQDH